MGERKRERERERERAREKKSPSPLRVISSLIERERLSPVSERERE